MKKKVKLSSYQKPFGVWVNDPAGMICKVAEAQALRDSFPTMLGGMLMREEIIDVPAEVTTTRPAKRPDFARGLPAPEMTAKEAKPNQQPRTAAEATEPPQVREDAAAEAAAGLAPEAPAQTSEAAPPPTSATDDHAEALTNVQFLLKKSGKTEEQLLAVLRNKKSARDDQRLEHLSCSKLINIGKANTWESLMKEVQ